MEFMTGSRTLFSATFPAVALCLLFCVPAGSGALQHAARPAYATPPAGDWDPAFVHANFDGLIVDSSNHLIFYYVLENSSNQDYRILDGSGVTVMARLRRPRGALQQLSAADVKVFYPILLPTGQRHILQIRDLRRTYAHVKPLKLNPNPTDTQVYEAGVAAALRRRWPALDGLVLYDQSTRRQIILPRKW
jgi:hypothetical protein